MDSMRSFGRDSTLSAEDLRFLVKFIEVAKGLLGEVCDLRFAICNLDLLAWT
jgi:glycogen debranching enzyme